MRIFQTARSRLYRGRFLQPNTHFLSIFRDLQDRHTFAPLEIQNLQIFCENLQNFGNFLRFLQNVAEIVSNWWFFVEIFAEFGRNCEKSQIIYKNLQNFKKFAKSKENPVKFWKFRDEILVVAATTKSCCWATTQDPPCSRAIGKVARQSKQAEKRAPRSLLS